MLQHHDDIPGGYVTDRIAQHGASIQVLAAGRPAMPDPRRYDLIVALGSYDSAFDESLPYVRRERRLLAAAVEAGVPVLGICFGAQLLSLVLGGTVQPRPDSPEIGWMRVHGHLGADAPESSVEDPVVPGPWLVWHHDTMSTPPDAVRLASTAVAHQAFRHGRHLAVQFHPEATEASVRRWAAQDVAGLRAAGVDRDELLAAVSKSHAAARSRAYALTDTAIVGAFRPPPESTTESADGAT